MDFPDYRPRGLAAAWASVPAPWPFRAGRCKHERVERACSECVREVVVAAGLALKEHADRAPRPRYRR